MEQMLERNEIDRWYRQFPGFIASVDDPDALAQLAPIIAEINTAWRWKVRELNAAGYSWRTLAKALGESVATTHYRYSGAPVSDAVLVAADRAAAKMEILAEEAPDLVEMIRHSGLPLYGKGGAMAELRRRRRAAGLAVGKDYGEAD